MTLLAGEITQIKQPRLLFKVGRHRLELQTILLGGVGKSSMAVLDGFAYQAC